MQTFLWHDYETFGADPRRDRPAQFAAIRTTPELEVVGDPLSIFCKPAPDVLPSPGACLVTGIFAFLVFVAPPAFRAEDPVAYWRPLQWVRRSGSGLRHWPAEC